MFLTISHRSTFLELKEVFATSVLKSLLFARDCNGNGTTRLNLLPKIITEIGECD